MKDAIIQSLVDERKKQNITQKDLATRVGMSQVSVCRIEKRTKNPSLETLYYMAHELGLTFKITDKADQEVTWVS